jgi:hypothetical protein
VAEFEGDRRISDEVGGQGGFRKTAELVGVAQPRVEGLLASELSKTPCVWFRYRVEREYEVVEYRDGRRQRSKRTEQVAEHTSPHWYTLVDDQGGAIPLDPNGTSPDRAEQTVDSYEPHHGQGRPTTFFGIELPSFLAESDSTIGFKYQEWVIRPGTRLYVLGEVNDSGGRLTLGKPQQTGTFIISTRSEQELRDTRVKHHRYLAIAVIAAATLGTALIITGILR